MLLIGIPLIVVGALLLPAALLLLSAAVETRVLSPRAMIVSAARARRVDPAFTETFVATEVERLLRNAQSR